MLCEQCLVYTLFWYNASPPIIKSLCVLTGGSTIPILSHVFPFSSSVDVQKEAYKKCLKTYFLETCFDNNGHTVKCNSEDAIDSFNMSDW